MNSTAPKASRLLFSIKGKLFLAFCTMTLMTIVAAGVAWHVFDNVQEGVSRITRESVPAMAASLQLAQEASELTSSAPALMASSNQEERIWAQAKLEQRASGLSARTQALRKTGLEQARVENIQQLEKKITGRLRELAATVEKILRIKVEREALVAGVAKTQSRFLEVLEPLVDDSMFNLVISGEDMSVRSTRAINDLVEGGVRNLQRLLVINAEINLAAGLLAEAAHVPTEQLVTWIQQRFNESATRIETDTEQLGNPAEQAQIREAIQPLLGLGQGDRNLFSTRKKELRLSQISPKLAKKETASMVVSARSAHANLLIVLLPIVQSATAQLVSNADRVTTENSSAITQLVEQGVHTLHLLLTLRAETNLATSLLAEAANIADPTGIQPLHERFVASMSHIQTKTSELPQSPFKSTFQELTRSLESFGQGNDGIFAQREQELLAVATAEENMRESRALAAQLGGEVSQLVAAARTKSDAAAVSSAQAIATGQHWLIAIAVLSISGAIGLMLFYVAPSVVRPLESITTAMSALAAGDTSVDVPARDRSDEIGRMAQALGVFRDTAIAVQETNLEEIRAARRRLSDAIESISEGFTLFDPDDRLVLSNSRFSELLYPDSQAPTQGTTFEEMIRSAALEGHIHDAVGREEEWIKQRLEQHRNPTGSHIVHRGDGRWIQLTERKTEDGGTVGVQFDITELKEANNLVTEKNKMLESLSAKLSKYLSPQVYRSIFTGEQEVEITAKRKKLTIFFSDIANFTETSDNFESEELTNVLNQYLTEMSSIALRFGATIDKYVGDAIMLFFGDPETRGIKEDALACVKMAAAMQKRMRELQFQWLDQGNPRPFQIRVGIDTGFCTVGNFGSEDRMDYTIIGNEVNLAARLQTHAELGSILLAHETYALVKDNVLAEEQEPIQVKGFAKPIRTYKVIRVYDETDDEGRIIRHDSDGIRIFLDMNKVTARDKNVAVEQIEHVLSQLKT